MRPQFWRILKLKNEDFAYGYVEFACPKVSDALVLSIYIDDNIDDLALAHYEKLSANATRTV